MRKQAVCALAAGLLAVLLALAPGLAWALGLGQIQSETRIGQDLRARIPILAAKPGVLQGLTVGLAGPDAYHRAGIREADFLFNLKFQVKQDANGPYVLITSSQPVRLPFLNILVRAHWASGDVTRQYTLLLNPPVFASAHPGQTQTSTPVAAPTTPRRQTPITRPRPSPTRLEPPPKPSYVVQQPASARPARPGVYGPVQRGQTLWGIASNLHSTASINQMMIAIYRANPRAFSGNIDRLKAGATLHIPSHAEVERISRTAANAEVARQIEAWKAARPSEKTLVAKETPPASARPPVKRAGGSGKAAANGAGHTTRQPSASRAGEVVLTAPKVTQSVAAAGGGVAAGSGTAGTATAAGALAGKKTVGSGSAGAGAVPAVSAGGPAKLHNAELANLAAAGQAASTAKTPAKPPAHAAAQTGAKAGKPAAVHTAAGTSTFDRLSGTVWNWLTSVKGWVVIALIVLFLILMIFLLARRRRRREEALMAMAAGASGDAQVRRREEPSLGASAGDVSSDEMRAAVVDDGQVLPGGAEAEGSEEPKAASRAEAAVPDDLVQAERYAAHGDYAGAARVLNGALEAEPERNDLRLRLLETLFAAGEGSAFLAAAEALYRRVPESGSDWRAVTVMGHELLPDEPLFAAGGGSAEADRGAEPTDFEFELDRLDEQEPAGAGLPDEFERSLGELSTMIETYMPESGEGPVELQLPPEEERSPAAAAGEDLAAVGQADGRDRLELARAYLDMGDRESARTTLESLLGSGDETQRAQAQRMLDGMDSKSADDLLAEYGGALESTEESLAADGESFAAEESGTAMDLARAYLELGDRESARDILEEILDGESESQREKARELLETLN